MRTPPSMEKTPTCPPSVTRATTGKDMTARRAGVHVALAVAAASRAVAAAARAMATSGHAAEHRVVDQPGSRAPLGVAAALAVAAVAVTISTTTIDATRRYPSMELGGDGGVLQ